MSTNAPSKLVCERRRLEARFGQTSSTNFSCFNLNTIEILTKAHRWTKHKAMQRPWLSNQHKTVMQDILNSTATLSNACIIWWCWFPRPNDNFTLTCPNFQVFLCSLGCKWHTRVTSQSLTRILIPCELVNSIYGKLNPLENILSRIVDNSYRKGANF